MTLKEQTNDTATPRGRAAIYARGAPTQTTQPQTNTLIALANEQGYPNEQIIVYEDVSVSARRPIARRGALNDLLTAIMDEIEEETQPGKIQTLFVSSLDRLFRDPAASDIATFVRICAEHGVRLVIPSRAYDF